MYDQLLLVSAYTLKHSAGGRTETCVLYMWLLAVHIAVGKGGG